MFSFPAKEMPSPSSLFSAYASMSASIMLFRSMANELIPIPLRNYLLSTLRYIVKLKSPNLTLVIEEFSASGMGKNLVFDAAELYLSTKVSPDTERLRICKTPKGKNLTVGFCQGETIRDNFDGIELKWRYICEEARKKSDRNDDDGHFPLSAQRQRLFELSFHKKNREAVFNSYVPMMLERAELIQHKERILKMFTLAAYKGCMWDSVNLEHPSTFETLAMEPEDKTAIIHDLDRFVSRKEFYKRVGKAWKRGYLLYGPPGTGKSSLVAAMANYLRFDVYDLQLGNVKRDSDLRRLLLAIGNRSILVIEDIDCSVDLPDRKPVQVQSGGGGKEDRDQQGQVQLSLSGLLNFVDGLWSSCGDERIIVFTTNHKERLDPALLRPGRMDMHIHMSYCTPPGFRTLASNYLCLRHHRLFGEIEGLLRDAEVTPAQVAEEMMKSEDADVALEGVVKFLKRRKPERDEAAKGADAKKLATQETDDSM